MLLNMTSGYADYVRDEGFVAAFYANPFRHWTPEELIAIGVSKPLMFEPGTNWGYAHTCYVIMGRVIEKVTGRPLGEVTAERIFAPLGLAQLHPAVDRHPRHDLGVHEVALRAPHLPDAVIGLAPDLAHVLDQHAAQRPRVVRQRVLEDLGGVPHHVEHLAVDVELELPAGAVADPHGCRPLVAPEPRDLVLVEAPLAGDWTVEVIGRPSKFEELRATFTVPIGE